MYTSNDNQNSYFGFELIKKYFLVNPTEKNPDLGNKKGPGYSTPGSLIAVIVAQ